MESFRFSVGSLVTRGASDPAAVAPAAADTLLPLSNLGSGYPDEQGGLQWRSDGAYDIDFDLNLLADDSERADAPTGWADLPLYLAGMPGLPANPPDWGNYGARNPALRFFGPIFQDVDVMPGEQVKIAGSIYLPAASTSTSVVVRVVDLTTGRQYDATALAWDDDGTIESQAVDDTWKEFAVTIQADISHAERRVYRVTVTPTAAAYGATTYGYISAYGAAGSPAVFAEVDAIALIGHNLPEGATVQLQPQPAGMAIGLTPAQPSSYAVTVLAQLVQTWRLSIDIPAALRPSAPRPIIGEVWIGKVRTLLGGSPVLPISLTEGDASQVRVEGTGGRLDVLGSGTPARAELLLEFTFDNASYKQARDQVARLTRFGEDPLLLLPSQSFEGAGRLYHGRIGQEVAYSRISPGTDEALRSFTWEFAESPLAAP